MRPYLDALRQRDFGLLWIGATLSILGDGMTLVALVWLVYERSGSAADIGWLTFWYTAPVIVGGFAAGWLLDRFDRRRVLMADTLARGVVMGSVPVLHLLDALPTWYLFAVAGVYGFLKMVPLAGVPAMIPALAGERHLTTANALETMSYGVGGIIGPGLAGVLVATIGAPAVVGIDALTYFAFLACLAAIRRPSPSQAVAAPARAAVRRAAGYGPAVRIFLASPAILATTLMFMAFNVGEGIFTVVLPVYAVEVLGRDATAYGLLIAAFSVGLLVGAFIVGGRPTPERPGRAIAAVQLLAGCVLAGFVLLPPFAAAIVLAAAFGLVASPLTIWAQTLRMRLIPAELRGRVFALLRTMMQSTPPIGAIIAGAVLTGAGVVPAVALAAALVVVPGAIGLTLPALAAREQDLEPASVEAPAQASAT